MQIAIKNKISLAEEVLRGFSQKPKRISSMFFYDAAGDALFQKIMQMPEYYLTRCEKEIFHLQKEQILQSMDAFKQPFNLLEFGAGDGEKTKILLRYLLEKGADFTYYPVDISSNILEELEESLQNELPMLKVHPLNYEYFDAIRETVNLNNRRNITLFLGSNMGNFAPEQAMDFFKTFSSRGKSGDLLLVGIDRKKNPHTILNAYNDASGITAAFNLNLLTRMNRELGANFNPGNFEHYTYYEPISGEVRSFLVSLRKQEVGFGALDQHFTFEENEFIHTEISKKYSQKEIEELGHKTGFDVLEHYTDKRHYYLNSLWEIK